MGVALLYAPKVYEYLQYVYCTLDCELANQLKEVHNNMLIISNMALKVRCFRITVQKIATLLGVN